MCWLKDDNSPERDKFTRIHFSEISSGNYLTKSFYRLLAEIQTFLWSTVDTLRPLDQQTKNGLCRRTCIIFYFINV